MVLLAIGAAHLFLLWNGDILVEYAVAGVVVLPFLFGPRWLTLLTATAFLLLFFVMPLLPSVVQFPSQFWIRDHLAEAAGAYGNGKFYDALAFRVREIPAIFPLHVLIFPRTVALFLFGALAWRSGILQKASKYSGLLFGIAMGGVMIGGALTAAAQGRHLELDFLWLRFWTVRQIECVSSFRNRGLRVRDASCYQRLVVGPVPVWSGRMAVALTDVWPLAADGPDLTPRPVLAPQQTCPGCRPESALHQIEGIVRRQISKIGE